MAVRSGPTIKSRLLGGIVCVAIPIVVFVAAVVVELAQSERQAVTQRSDAQLALIAAEVEDQLAQTRSSLELLAQSPASASGNFAALRAAAISMAAGSDFSIMAADRTGAPLFDTEFPVTMAPPSWPRADDITQTLAAMVPLVTDVVTGTGGVPMVAEMLPVQRQDGGAYVLAARFEPSQFTRHFRTVAMPEGALGAIIDRSGRIVTRIGDGPPYTGDLASPQFLQTATGDAGRLSTINRQGTPVETGYKRLAGSGWRVAYALPKAVLEAPLRRYLLLLTIGAVMTVGVVIFAAVIWARSIVRPFDDLSNAALALGRGDEPVVGLARAFREAAKIGEALTTAYHLQRTEEAERRLAEAKLRESEQLRRAAAQAAEIGMFSRELDGDIPFWDDNFRRLAGIGASQPASYDLLRQAVVPEDRAMIDRTVADLRRDHQPRMADFRIVWPDGGIHWLRLCVGVEVDDSGTPVRVAGVIMNIDQLKRVEQELRGSEERLQTIFRQAAVGIVQLDRDGRFVLANEHFHALVGRSQAEMQGMSLIDITQAEDRAQTRAAFEQAVETGEAVEIEKRYLRPDGSVLWINKAISVLHGADDQVDGFIAIVQDIGPRKEAEEARAVLGAQLRQAHKMEAVGQLTGGIAHDFNNLLLAIHLNIEGIKELRPNDAKVSPLVTGAADAAEQARTLTRQLLAFGRRQTLFPATLEPNNIVRRVQGILRRTLEASIDIDLALAERPWMVLADQNQLENALLNLAINARDAMPGGGRLTIATANQSLGADNINIAGGELIAGDYVVIRVTDTGTGMTAEIKERAFEPFFSTKRAENGSGLGLSQVYGFIKQSGGHATLTSEPGAGTTVTLYLPRSRDTQVTVAVDTGTRDVAGGTERILLVEDNDLVRKSVRKILISLGYDVVAAADVPEARMLAQTEKFDLLFTDVMLPGRVSGADLARELRENFPDLPVLLTSGYAQDPTQWRNDNAPGFPIIFKPYTKAELAPRLRAVIEGVEA